MKPLYFLLLGIPIGLAIGLGVLAITDQAPVEPATVNLVCESFEGPQGPAGADGKDGASGTVTFKHDPELLGLFSEQNVEIEYKD